MAVLPARVWLASGCTAAVLPSNCAMAMPPLAYPRLCSAVLFGGIASPCSQIGRRRSWILSLMPNTLRWRSYRSSSRYRCRFGLEVCNGGKWSTVQSGPVLHGTPLRIRSRVGPRLHLPVASLTRIQGDPGSGCNITALARIPVHPPSQEFVIGCLPASLRCLP